MVITVSMAMVFIMIMARFLGLFMMAPIFSSRTIPAPMKLCLITWITIVIFMITPIPMQLPSTMLSFAIAVFNEFLVGYILGFVAHLIVVSVQEAGSLMDMQMGLSVASALDPASGTQTTIISRLMYQMALLIFVLVDGHHALLGAVQQSFRVIPVATLVIYPGLMDQLGYLAGQIFSNALLLAMPIIVVIFLLDFSLGLLGRVAPQVNVFFLGFQLKPVLGLWVLLITLPYLGNRVTVIIQTIVEQTLEVFAHVQKLV